MPLWNLELIMKQQLIFLSSCELKGRGYQKLSCILDLKLFPVRGLRRYDKLWKWRKSFASVFWGGTCVRWWVMLT